MTAIIGHLTLTYDDGGGPRALAAMSGATLEVHTEVLPAANPDAYGWERTVPGIAGWSLSAMHLQAVGAGGVRVENQALLEQAAHGRRVLDIVLETEYGAVYSGKAIVESRTVSADVGTVMAGSYRLRGAGALDLDQAGMTPCGTQAAAGGPGEDVRTYGLGFEPGWVHMAYNHGNGHADLLEVIYEGTVVASTPGQVTGTGYLKWFYAADAGRPRAVTIRVDPVDHPQTLWSYEVRCPIASEDPPPDLSPPDL